ncbi:MAG: endolytic transglycosylase MltG [Actinomycetota bacterium]
MNGDPLLPNDWHDDPWDRVSETSVDSLESLSPEFEQLRGITRTVAIVVAASLLFLGAIGFWTIRVLNPSGNPGVAVNFTVNDGDTISSIATRLENAGIVSNATIFRWYASTKGKIILTPGYYALHPRDDAGSIIEALATPPAQTFISVTFPEGMTVAQMAQRLAEKMTFMKVADFVAASQDISIPSTLRPKTVTSLEGLLFPDTYQISGDDTEARVVARLASMMERVARQVDLTAGAKTRGFSPYEILIIASLIEREAKVPADRSKIAQVIYNRLAKKMKLEVDASVKYGQDPAMSWTDMKATDTPYNTYLHEGLPPTPIANPGKASIQAALAPFGTPPPTDAACVGLPVGVKCEYLYYVLADAAGSHVFATTYEQHLANVEKAKAAGLLP